MNFRSHACLFLMVFILLLAFFLGARELNRFPVWGDELSTLTNIGAFDPPYTPSAVVKSLLHYTPLEMPAFLVVSALWAQLAGWSQFVLRLLSLFAGLAFVAFVYRFAAENFGKNSGLFAALLLSTNAFVLVFFSEFRTYTLLLLTFMVHLWLYARLWRCRKPTTAGVLLFALSGSMMLYTHLVSVVMIVALVFVHIISQPKNHRWRQILVAWTISFLLFLPYALGLLREISEKTNDPGAASTLELLIAIADIASNGLLWLMLPLLGSLVYLMLRRRRWIAQYIFLVAIASFLVLLFLNMVFNVIVINRMRYFLPVISLMLILFSAGLASIARRRVFGVAVLVISCVAGVGLAGSNESVVYAGLIVKSREFPPLNRYVYHLRDKLGGDEFVLGFTKHEVINEPERFSSHSFVDYYLQAQLGIDGVFLHTNRKRYRLEQDVRSILRAHPHVLLAHDPSNVPLNYARTLAIIEEAYLAYASLVEEPALRIRKYAHPVMGCDREPASIQYENGARLLDRAIEFDIDDQRIDALTWWNVPDEAMLDEYNISLQIISSEGKNVRQTDRHLYDNIVPWSVIDLSTEELPADDYELVLILYRRDSGSKVVGVDQSTEEFGSILPLLGFTRRLEDAE